MVPGDVGDGGDLKHPLASPLYADLTGLPRTLILVGTNEALLDDSARMAAFMAVPAPAATVGA